MKVGQYQLFKAECVLWGLVGKNSAALLQTYQFDVLESREVLDRVYAWGWLQALSCHGPQREDLCNTLDLKEEARSPEAQHRRTDSED